MKLKTCVLSFATLGLVATSALALRQQEPPAMPKLPAGWTMADVQMCMEAGQPGKQHEWLGKMAGEWKGQCTMWMAPDSEAIKTDCKETIKPIMGGRYMESKMESEMPGMGPFSGMGLAGFDNVSQKYVGTWIDSMGTGIMNGTGVQSADGKTIKWEYNFNCPMTKKPIVMKQIETHPDDNTMTLEMWSVDPKSGKDFKCMYIELKKS